MHAFSRNCKLQFLIHFLLRLSVMVLAVLIVVILISIVICTIGRLVVTGESNFAFEIFADSDEFCALALWRVSVQINDTVPIFVVYQAQRILFLLLCISFFGLECRLFWRDLSFVAVVFVNSLIELACSELGVLLEEFLLRVLTTLLLSHILVDKLFISVIVVFVFVIVTLAISEVLLDSFMTVTFAFVVQLAVRNHGFSTSLIEGRLLHHGLDLTISRLVVPVSNFHLAVDYDYVAILIILFWLWLLFDLGCRCRQLWLP